VSGARQLHRIQIHEMRPSLIIFCLNLR
jgi:hypothetical protein